MYKSCTLRTAQMQQYCILCYYSLTNQGIIFRSKSKTKQKKKTKSDNHSTSARHDFNKGRNHRAPKLQLLHTFIYLFSYIFVWIYERIRALPRRFFLQSRRYKIKRNGSLFFSYTVYLPFITLLTLFFVIFLRVLEAASRSCEIKLHMGDLAQIINTVFIYPVRYVIIRFTYDQRLCQLIQLLNVEIRSVRPSVQCPERNLQITKIHTFHYVLVKHKFSSTFESNK